jgi:mono/diheme cytochrome c family protein
MAGRCPFSPLPALALLAVACHRAEDSSDEAGLVEAAPPPVDDREIVIAEAPPVPIVGASLTVIDDARVVVTDPDRDVVVIVGPAEELKVSLPAGAQPWRAVLDHEHRVHVALRGAGAVATIDVETAELLAIRSVCPTVRGIGLRTEPARRLSDAPTESLYVACAGGEVVTLATDPDDDASQLVARLDPDLRDVVVDASGDLFVTRFRAAEVLALDLEDGAVAGRAAPPPWTHMSELGEDSAMRASTAWRTFAHPAGGWVMLHQGGSATAIDPAAEPEDDPESDPAYGGGDTCDAIVQGALAYLDADGVLRASGSIAGALLPVDAAIHPDGNHVAIAIAGTCATQCSGPQIVELTLDSLSAVDGGETRPCMGGSALAFIEPTAQIVAVAYSPSGKLWALQREPSILHLFDGVGQQRVRLSDVSVEDTGHRLFHEAGRAGVTCASCHPEGGDDGLTWNLPQPLHTPALYVELAGTEPFHWRGDLPDFGELVHEVHEKRMGEALQSDARIDAFERWVTKLRTAPPRVMDGAAEAGRELFTSYGCATCHQGVAMTNGQTVAMGSSTAVQVPTLRAVSLHPPYMHDGRAATLADAVREMIAATGDAKEPTDADVDRLVAYLETL